MTANRFFIKSLDGEEPYVLLSGDEHHHLRRVVRLGVGDEVWLFDEKGRCGRARIDEVAPAYTRLFILERQVGGERAGVQITLAQALVTSKKMDFIVQKGTELGIAAFVPVISSRSIIKLENRTAQKVERWRKVAREASKQCRNVHPPEIWLPQPFQTVLCRREERKLFLSENNGEFLKDILLRNSEWGGGKRPASVLVLTGPEGGWTKKEEEEIIDHGFEAVSLGKYILRAETASFCAVALIAHFWDA